MSLFDSGLEHSVSIYSPTVVQDASKGEVITWTTLRAANVPCLILQGRGNNRDEFSQSQRPVSEHTIAFSDYDGGVQPGDRLTNDKTGAVYAYDGGRPQQGVGGIADWNLIGVREMEV